MGKATTVTRLRARLEDKGWTQSKLAEAIGVAPAVVSRWMSGERRPSLEMACRLEAVLGIPVEAWRSVARAS